MHIVTLFHITAAGVTQALLLTFAWGFTGRVLTKGQVVIPEGLLDGPLVFHGYTVGGLILMHTRALTAVVSLFATVLAVAGTMSFSASLKEALRCRMKKRISLVEVTAGIIMTRTHRFFDCRHLFLSFLTYFIWVLTVILVSSWTTLLTPKFLTIVNPANGSELDLGTGYFESQLYQELLLSGSVVPFRGNSVEIIDIDGLLSGINTARAGSGASGLLSFNGVSYNVSTGGVLPAVPYYGSQQQAQGDNSGLNFVGGYVPTNLQFNLNASASFFGASNFSVVQHGLTANVTCSQIPSSSLLLNNITTSQATIPVGIFSTQTTYLLASAYNLTCSEGYPARQEYVTRENDLARSTNESGIMYSLVCPYPIGQAQLDWTQFSVTSVGTGKYSFLQQTNCEIVPQLTTSLVTYGNNFGLLDVTVLNSTGLTSNNSNLALFLASMINYESANSQGLVSNSIGDALYTISATTNGALDDSLLREMEQYWRGVIEFSGTYLRSAFSAYPIVVPPNGTVNIQGYQTIRNLGWSMQSWLDAYTAIPVTILGILTFAAIIYTILHDEEKWSGWRTKSVVFDPTNPIHLIMVSSAPPTGRSRNLGSQVEYTFNEDSIGKNEEMSMRLDDVPPFDNQKDVRKCLIAINSEEPQARSKSSDEAAKSDAHSTGGKRDFRASGTSDYA